MTNLVMHDLETASSELLLDRRALITRLEYAQPQRVTQIPDHLLRHLTLEEVIRIAEQLESGDWPQDLLIVGLVEHDTNGDGVLAGDDATVAYAVSLADRTRVRLTPETMDWQQLSRLLGGRTLLRVSVDVNGDGRFEPWEQPEDGPSDECRYFLVDLSAPTEATPIVPEGIRNQVLQTAGISVTQTAPQDD